MIYRKRERKKKKLHQLFIYHYYMAIIKNQNLMINSNIKKKNYIAIYFCCWNLIKLDYKILIIIYLLRTLNIRIKSH